MSTSSTSVMTIDHNNYNYTSEEYHQMYALIQADQISQERWADYCIEMLDRVVKIIDDGKRRLALAIAAAKV